MYHCLNIVIQNTHSIVIHGIALIYLPAIVGLLWSKYLNMNARKFMSILK